MGRADVDAVLLFEGVNRLKLLAVVGIHGFFPFLCLYCTGFSAVVKLSEGEGLKFFFGQWPFVNSRACGRALGRVDFLFIHGFVSFHATIVPKGSALSSYLQRIPTGGG
jgi:hypothetical protein